MITSITEDIKVSVETTYQPPYSNPANNHYMFSYHIRIENLSSYTVQLMRRHWYIFDSNGEWKEVEGEGVVGQQPVLNPGDVHEYVSGCNLKTGMGKMLGSYQMEKLVDGSIIEVNIPEFQLICEILMN